MKADEVKPSKTSDEEKPKITGHFNSTITPKKYSNSTTTKHQKSSSPKTTQEPSTTSDASSSASESASAPSSTGAPDSGAMTLVPSTIALVACLVAGFFLNGQFFQNPQDYPGALHHQRRLVLRLVLRLRVCLRAFQHRRAR